jgi:hypothetical protein
LSGLRPSRKDWNTWPTWKVSAPASPKAVTGARVSSKTKVSSPARPNTSTAPLMSPS